MGYYRELGVIRAEPGVLRAEADDFRLGRGVHVAGRRRRRRHSSSFFQDSMYHNRRRGLRHRDRRFLHRRAQLYQDPGQPPACAREAKWL